MASDPYSACPCGSGKKFKWCCQPIYAQIQHIWSLEQNEQHEAAARVAEQLVKEHPNNPEAWGQQALLFVTHGKVEQAEAALEQAFALNPNYPTGLMLRARLRYAEGEYLGCLHLARKAVEAYSPETREALGQVHTLIFDCEMRCNRPVAARAALAQAVTLLPEDAELRDSLETIFGPQGRFPAAVSRPYEYRKPVETNNSQRRQAWNQAFSTARKLSDAVKAFENLTQQDPTDSAAWFNLGLTRAWLGENKAAIAALDRYLELESDESAAVEAAALIEVLRFGYGMDEECDYHEYSFIYQITNPAPVQALLEEWNRQKRLVTLPTQEEGVFYSMVLEISSSGLVTVGKPASDIGWVAGYLFLVGQLLRFASPVKERYDRIKEEVRRHFSLGLTDLRERHGPAQFTDLVTESLTLALQSTDQESQKKSVLEQAARYYETVWIHRPRKSLSNIAPVDAVGSRTLRRKLLGVIQLIEEGARRGVLAEYNFDGLRRKLGLLDSTTATLPSSGDVVDIAAMGPAELSGLNVSSLSDEQLEKAYQTAYRLDAQELAEHFAKALIQRPINEAKPDRYPWYSFLIQKSLRDGELDTALDQVNEGEKHDCEANGGKRRNDFELFRAQVHGKRGETEIACDVFQRLIQRTPRDFKVRGKAAEAMISWKQPQLALKFAEEGVAAARQANDRDSEQYLLELIGAAKRQLAR